VDESDRRTKRSRRHHYQVNDFKIKVLRFEGMLDSNEFVDGLHILEWVFDHEEILADKNVNLVALNLKKYVSLYLTNSICQKSQPKKKENQNLGRNET